MQTESGGNLSRSLTYRVHLEVKPRDDAPLDAMVSPVLKRIPEKYRRQSTRDLVFEAVEGQNEFDILL